MKTTNKMNPEIKALWVDALRSGEYQQGKLLLKPTKNTFCCLGVLCDLAVKAKAEGVVWGDIQYPIDSNGEAIYYDDPDNYGESMSEDSELPYPVMRWAGLMSENPKVEVFDEEKDEDGIRNPEVMMLSQLNDDHNFTFQQLADIIERQL